jgi:hypothetical protein
MSLDNLEIVRRVFATWVPGTRAEALADAGLGA